jgi:acetylornithine deacetylase/succinyl-diaminopimelate desuccinylase-like protein
MDAKRGTWRRPLGPAVAALLVSFCAAAPPAVRAGGPDRPASGPADLSMPELEIIDLLQRYLRIDTSNPPGNEIAAARFFRDLFAREGIEATIYEFEPGRANIVARLEGDGTRGGLILSNHMDVVIADRDEWSVDPFGGELIDGYVYGRGALDMKTTGLLQAATLINLKRAGAALNRDLIFLGTADEEVDAAGIEWMTWEHGELLKGAEFMLNEGGMIDEEGGAARSYNVAVTEKAPFWIRIRAEGRSGHGSQPFTEDNAVHRLLRALDRLSRYQPPVKVTESVDAFFKALAGTAPPRRAAIYRDIRAAVENPMLLAALTADPALNAILRNTIAITMLEGAPQINIIPSVAQAQLDVRLLPGEDPGRFLEEIRGVVERTGVTLEPLGRFRAATESPLDSDLVRAIDRVRGRHHPGAVLAPTMLTGWTESAAVRPLGIKAYGFQPYVLDAAERERIHGEDERISVDNVLRGARLLEEIVRELCGAPPPPRRSAAQPGEEGQEEGQDDAEQDAARERHVDPDAAPAEGEIAGQAAEQRQPPAEGEEQPRGGDQEPARDQDPAQRRHGPGRRHDLILADFLL